MSLAWGTVALLSFPGRIRDRSTFLFEKTGEIVGHIVDMVVVAAFHFPIFVKHFPRAARNDEDRVHSERFGHGKVARQILEHDGVGSCHGVKLGEA